MALVTLLVILLGLMGAMFAIVKGGWFFFVGIGFGIASLLPKLVQNWRGSETAVGVSLLLDVVIASACILAIARMEGEHTQAPKLGLLIIAALLGGSVLLHSYFFLGMAAGSQMAMVIYAVLTSLAWVLASLTLIFGDHIGKRVTTDDSDLSDVFSGSRLDRSATFPVNASRDTQE